MIQKQIFVQLNFIQKMGNEQGSCQVETFKMQDWQLTDRYDNYKVWRHQKDHSQRIEEYSIYVSNDQELKYEEQMYQFRKYHPNLVAAYFFDSSSQSELCSSSHSLKLFIEKIPIRLSDIQHIPFPDLLHIYSQALQGFQILSRHPSIGFFAIEEEYIGINNKGVVKVWMNENYSKNYYLGSKVSQEFMVNSIIQTIERNVDHNRIPKNIPSVRNYLYRNTDKLKFQQANRQFQKYLAQYNLGYAPSKLDCIDQAGGIQAIANRDRQINQQKSNNIKQMEMLDLNKNRPQLIESQISKNQFSMLTPRIQSPPYYYEVPRGDRIKSLNNSQVVPNIQNNILSPAVVRQNTPIIRKSGVSFYKPINEFNVNPTNINKINNQSNKSSTARLQQRPVFINHNTNFPILPYRQIIIPPNQINRNNYISKPIVIQRPNSVRHQNEVVQKSFIDLVQPQRIMQVQKQTIMQQNFKSSKTIFSHQEGSQKNIIPQNSFQLNQVSKSHTNSFSRQPQRRPNSSYLQFNKQVVSHSAKKSFDDQLLSNTRPKIIEARQWQQKMNQFANKYSNTKTQKIQASSKQKDFTDVNNTASGNSVAFRQNRSINIKQSQYTTIDIDDGKSSIDFLKKLKQFEKFNVDFNQPQLKQQSPQFHTYYRQKANSNNKLLTKQANSVQNLHSAQQFGRNAVSNIITNQSGVLSEPKVFDNTPLKFQNNLDMKYSMFKEDSPQVSYGMGYVSRNYSPYIDADIQADLNNLKGNL